jgi:hypothetical protein
VHLKVEKRNGVEIRRGMGDGGGGLLEACPEATIRQIVISWEERKKAGAYLAAV